MNNQGPTGQVCQSCSMPMAKKEDFGTNADGSSNKEYCHYCFQNGKFTTPNATMDQIIEISAGAMRKMHMPEKLIAETRQFIPTLKRWKK
ncbi:MAG: zinc ribbon domain-containing protein [Bacteroidia bacterium]